MALTKVTRNFQITVPRDAREILDISEGDLLIVEQKENELTIKKMSKDPVEVAFGSWKSVKDSVEFVRKLRDDSEKRLKRMGL